MPAPTVNLTVTVLTSQAVPVQGALVAATLNRAEFYEGVLVPTVVSGETNVNGQVVLAVFPNALGVNNSQYDVTIRRPNAVQVTTIIAYVPNYNCNLEDIGNLPPYPGVPNNQANFEGSVASQAAAAVSAAAALSSELAAQSSEDAALGSQTAAAASAASASSNASLADADRIAAQAAALAAEAWAETPYLTEVEPGSYSAKHWATVAQGAAAGSLTYMGGWSAAGGTYPVAPALGNFYIITVAGTISAIAYSIGDHIVYNGTTWDKLDNTDAVASVNGQTGVVVLSKSDVGLGNVSNNLQLIASSNLSDLANAVTARANLSVYSIAQTDSALAGKSAVGHVHVIADTTGLQAALDVKLGVSAKAADSELLDGYDSTAFPRKAEAASISGAWTFLSPTTWTSGPIIKSTNATLATSGWRIGQGSPGQYDGSLIISSDHGNSNNAELRIPPGGGPTWTYGTAVNDEQKFASGSSGSLAYYQPYSITYGGGVLAARGNVAGTAKMRFDLWSNDGVWHQATWLTVTQVSSGASRAAVFNSSVEVPTTLTVGGVAVSLTGHTHAIADTTGLQAALDAKLASASYTAADVLAKLLTVDGAASGLDADLLDGQTGAHYLAWANFTGVPLTFAPSAHAHDDLYFTEAEVTALLAGKLGVSATAADSSLLAGATPASYHAWANLTGVPSTFAPSAHTHDDRYYTESEVDIALAAKLGVAATAANSALLNSQAGSYYLAWANFTGVPATFAPSAHAHAIADTTGLQAALDGKSAAGHVHATTDITSGTFSDARIAQSNVTQHQAALTLTISQSTGLQAALDAKLALAGGTMTGDLRVGTGEAASRAIIVGAGAGYDRTVEFHTGSARRWRFRMGTGAETGANAGSGMNFEAWADDGTTLIDTVWSVARPAGSTLGIYRPVDFQGATVQHNGSTMWTAANDGAGSGLDADLLDGQQGAYYLPAGSYTAADVLAKLLTVDGAGSGLDADTLDGNTSAFYLSAASYTAADVLAKLLTVDGAGSGLDADLFDGFNSTSYFRYDGWVGSPGYDANTIAGNRSGFTYANNAPHTGPMVHFEAGGYGLQLNSTYTSSLSLSFRSRNGDGAVWNSWYTLWHNGNDGAGSGLDADYLDGYNSSSAVSPSTVAVRDSSSYLHASDFAASSGWFRNGVSGTGLYNSANSNHFYSDSSAYWNMTFGAGASGGLRFRTDHGSTVKGYIWWDSGGFGLLDQGGNWNVRGFVGSGFIGGALYGNWSTYGQGTAVHKIDASTGTASAVTAYLSLQSASIERGWVGFGENTTTMRVQNNIGILQLVGTGVYVSGYLNLDSGWMRLGTSGTTGMFTNSGAYFYNDQTHWIIRSATSGSIGLHFQNNAATNYGRIYGESGTLGFVDSGNSWVFRTDYANNKNVWSYGTLHAASDVNDANYYHAAIEVRERQYGGSLTDTWSNAPRIAFHWGGRIANNLAMSSGGELTWLTGDCSGYAAMRSGRHYTNNWFAAESGSGIYFTGGNAYTELAGGAVTYGTLSISGSQNSYAGIDFLGSYQSRHFMFQTGGGLHGVWNSTTSWDWYWDPGIATFRASGSYPVWHSNNDGSGSGLDADLLDGLNSTAFVLAGGVAKIFVQSGTPTATASGDLWFW